MPVLPFAASIAAAVIHFALGPEHVEELGLLGWGFYLAGVVQLGWAGLAVIASRRHAAPRAGRDLARLVPTLGIAVNVAILLAWGVARAVGLPTAEGSWAQEPIGVSDSITALLELGVLFALVKGRPRGNPASRPAAAESPEATLDGGVPSLVRAAPVLGLVVIATVMAIATPHGHAGDMQHGAGVEAVAQDHVH